MKFPRNLYKVEYTDQNNGARITVKYVASTANEVADYLADVGRENIVVTNSGRVNILS